jgi:hypothetical protein
MSGKQAERRARRPRRAWVHVAGASAVVICCAAFTAWALMSKPAETAVLQIAAPLAAGQMIAESDLVQVAVAAEDVSELGLMPASNTAEVVGQVAAIPLTTGTLLSTSMIGTPSTPRTGFAEVTLALADGRWPAALQEGHRVSLLGASDTAATGVWSAAGIVLGVQQPEEGGALVTVELPEATVPGLVTVEPASLLMVTTAPAVLEPAAESSSSLGGGN